MPQLPLLLEALKTAGQNPLFLTAFLAVVLLFAFRRAVKTDKGLELLHDLVGKKLTRAEFAKVANRLITTFSLCSVLATLLIGIWLVRDALPREATLYRVRVTVLDPGGTPVEEAQVWSSAGGEPQRVVGGWEFNIPEQSRPRDGKLTIFSAKPSAFLSGQAELTLGEDANPSVVVRLAKDESASVSGMVQDAQGNAIADALVSVIGHPASATTAYNGSFVLGIKASTGEMVQVHAEKIGFHAVTQSHLAGPDPAVLVLVNE